MGLSQSVKWGRGCRSYSEELAQPGIEDQPRDHSQRLSAHGSAGPFLACGKALIPSSHFCKRQFKPGEPPFTPLHAPPLPLEPSSVTLPLCGPSTLRLPLASGLYKNLMREHYYPVSQVRTQVRGRKDLTPKAHRWGGGLWFKAYCFRTPNLGSSDWYQLRSWTLTLNS